MTDQPPSLSLVDVHAHLAGETFARDLPEVLERARGQGVETILAVSESLADAEETLELSSQYPMIRACAGLHPALADPEEGERMLAFIRENRDRLAAIGEVGLDYWLAQDGARREAQRRILARHVALARELDLPLNVHSRSAGRHAIALLRELEAPRVLLHAFDGRASAAAAGLEAGYFFSIPPSVVRSPQKQKLLRHLPLERILLESDSPVLGPERDERNEPRNVWVACVEVARINSIPAEEVARVTTANARTLFPKAFS